MTIKEMKALAEYLKEIFMTKDDGKALENKIDRVQNTLDDFAKQTNDNTGEIKVLNKRVKATEDWIDQASPAVGIKFEH